ncbi:MAG: pyridoxamine 5'-phosphate oxidase family protein [Bacteroidia bacterium]|nr:pyridoxamine 5'-phosphate oxidase family protein [Bacteroidia bacterium]
MSDSYSIDSRNKVKRIPKRGHYDRETVHQILDASFLCHIGFVVDGQPYVIPTSYGRKGDTIYLHGASTSRMMVNLSEGIPVCITVTHFDGLVLARSAFHHSMNYRSAVVFGTAHLVEGEEKEEGLRIVSEQILEGRWEESRGPKANELKATTVLRVDIDTASAKIRTGGPGDDKPDYELPIWAGVVPAKIVYGQPEADPLLTKGIPLADSVKDLLKAE